jgi:hypothetical protein
VKIRLEHSEAEVCKREVLRAKAHLAIKGPYNSTGFEAPLNALLPSSLTFSHYPKEPPQPSMQ